ncbi:MAG: hypothetical protein QXX41_08520 [Nitrososphaerota archaeon]
MSEFSSKPVTIGVLGLGVPIHAYILAKNMRELLGSNYRVGFFHFDKDFHVRIPFKELDVLWNMGLFFNVDCLFDIAKEENPKIKIVNMWVGSDILWAQSFTSGRRKCRDCIVRNIDVHVADDEELGEEVEKLFGVKTYYVPTVPEQPFQPSPLPPEFAVAVYMHPSRKEFCNYDAIVEVAKENPDVPFYFFALCRPEDWGEPPLPNIHFIGWVSGETKEYWWRKCSALIYTPKHSGGSVTAIEFMQMGRYALITKNMPYAFHIKTREDLSNAIKHLKDKRELNLEASRYYLERYNAKVQVEHVLKILEKIGC